jgi:hypothetical protein
MRELDGMAEVEKSSLFGTAVHAVLRPGPPNLEALGRELAARGLDVRSIETVQPSLEDVFLDVVEKAERR